MNNSSQNQYQVKLQETAKKLVPLNQLNMTHGEKIEQSNQETVYVTGGYGFSFNFGIHDARTDKLLLKEKTNLNTLAIEELLSFRENNI